MTKANDNLFMGIVEGILRMYPRLRFCSCLVFDAFSFQTIIFVVYYFFIEKLIDNWQYVYFRISVCNMRILFLSNRELMMI